MRSRGLTLLEVLIAIAIIGVAFGVLVLSQALNYRVSARARALSELKAEAIRLAIARALVQLNEDYRRPLKEHKLLTRDAREVERKKYGKPKARKSFQFSKR